MSSTKTRLRNGDGGVRSIDISEFRDLGLLQEVNRRFFHPLGLALEVVIEADGSQHLGGVWDYRDDPVGILFEEGLIDPQGAAYVDRLWADHASARRALIGGEVQPA